MSSMPFDNADVTSQDAPMRLKKELDSVLTLQGHLDEINLSIAVARATFTGLNRTSGSLQALASLEETHEDLKHKMEVLYASLNIQDTFAELNGIDLEFVWTLLLARDLKINIRKRAIGSFIEWDRLDQAVGGRSAALGMFASL
jgi:hypothetical protein